MRKDITKEGIQELAYLVFNVPDLYKIRHERTLFYKLDELFICTVDQMEFLLEELEEDLNGDKVQVFNESGKLMFEGDCYSLELLDLLDLYICRCDKEDPCSKCRGGKYIEDLTIKWVSPNRKDNPYDFFND